MIAKVAVVSFSTIESDSRVLRQIESLNSLYDVYSVGYGNSPHAVVGHFEVDPRHTPVEKLIGFFLLLSRSFGHFHSRWFHVQPIITYLRQQNIQSVILNDVTSWPLARLLPQGISILDAHEYSPQELSDSLLWLLFPQPFKLWCSKFACLGVTRFCVEQHLCDLWYRFSGCDFQLLPNSSAFTPAPKSTNAISKPIRVLHHGVAHPSRRIELMVEAIALAGPSFSGTFLLTGSDTSYLRCLQELAQPSGCEILQPIPQNELISFGATFDLAILSIYPSNLNYANCLPNKLFQFIQSRLPIVCGPTPSIAKIVREYQIGVVADDFSPSALAAALQSLTPTRLENIRVNLDFAARQLCWDRDQHLLIDAVESVLNPGL